MLTRMFVDVPINVQTPPNIEAKESGIRSLDALTPVVLATPTIIGIRMATAAVLLMNAETDPTASMMASNPSLRLCFASRSRIVPIQLTAHELEAILTKTEIAKAKKLRPQLEAMATEGKTIDLDINDWSRVLLALCETGVKEMPVRKNQLGIARRIADHLAEALEIDAPTLRT